MDGHLMPSFDLPANVLANQPRLDECKAMAARLLGAKHPRSEEVAEQQDRLDNDWKLLHEYIDARDHKLAAASEIHLFNRDWSDVMDRIDEKRAAVPLGELGKDMASLQRHILKHEAFEAELVALETQVRSTKAFNISGSGTVTPGVCLSRRLRSTS